MLIKLSSVRPEQQHQAGQSCLQTAAAPSASPIAPPFSIFPSLFLCVFQSLSLPRRVYLPVNQTRSLDSRDAVSSEKMFLFALSTHSVTPFSSFSLPLSLCLYLSVSNYSSGLLYIPSRTAFVIKNLLIAHTTSKAAQTRPATPPTSHSSAFARPLIKV